MINRTSFLIGLLLLVSCLFSGSAGADSIWNQDSASPYGTDKAYKIGDIVNIVVLENTSAQNKANTNTNVSDDLSMKLTHTLQRLAPYIGTNNQVAGNATNKFQGTGLTNRMSNVQARISAWVTDILPNGNLQIKGNHRVEVNQEIQEITITGIIRPKDITGNNTIFSYQVADAQLSVSGNGVVAESESPGFLTRLFNWIF